MAHKSPYQRLIETCPLDQQEKLLELMKIFRLSDDLVVLCVQRATDRQTLLNLLSDDYAFHRSNLISMAETTSNLSFEAGFLAALNLIKQQLEANPNNFEAAIDYVKNQSYQSNLQLIQALQELQARMSED